MRVRAIRGLRIETTGHPRLWLGEDWERQKQMRVLRLAQDDILFLLLTMTGGEREAGARLRRALCFSEMGGPGCGCRG